jgi:hypothetical protein
VQPAGGIDVEDTQHCSIIPAFVGKKSLAILHLEEEQDAKVVADARKTIEGGRTRGEGPVSVKKETKSLAEEATDAMSWKRQSRHVEHATSDGCGNTTLRV